MTDTAASIVDQTPEKLFPQNNSDDLSSYAYRQLIGYLGLVFPFAVVLIARWRPTPVLVRFKVLDSVSAYYYTGSVAVFVGLLVALGLFLLTYRGYRNEYGRQDRLASRIAGWAAIIVAFFPTEAPVKSLEFVWWTETTGRLHFGAAIVLFCTFSYISLFLFTKTRQAKGTPLPTEKRVRNGVYIFCGIVMVGCIVWAGIVSYVNARGHIFLPESIALVSFAVSWLTKGRAEKTVARAALRTWYYVRNPKQFAAKVRSFIRRER